MKERVESGRGSGSESERENESGSESGSRRGRGSMSGSGGKSRSEGHVYRVVMDDDGVPSLVPLHDSSPQSTSQQQQPHPPRPPPHLHPHPPAVTRDAVTQTAIDDEPPFPAFANTFRPRSSHAMWANTYPNSYTSSSRGLGREPLRNYTAMFAKYKTFDASSHFWGTSPSKSSSGYKQRLDRRYHNLCTMLLSPED